MSQQIIYHVTWNVSCKKLFTIRQTTPIQFKLYRYIIIFQSLSEVIRSHLTIQAPRAFTKIAVIAMIAAGRCLFRMPHSTSLKGFMSSSIGHLIACVGMMCVKWIMGSSVYHGSSQFILIGFVWIQKSVSILCCFCNSFVYLQGIMFLNRRCICVQSFWIFHVYLRWIFFIKISNFVSEVVTSIQTICTNRSSFNYYQLVEFILRKAVLQ